MKRFRRSNLDFEFRRIVAAGLSTARKQVLVVTGEFSAFSNYIDLQWAVREAAMRGVDFRIYSNSFLPGIARKLMRWGCKLYTGDQRVDDHFMVVDGEYVVVSKAHPPGTVGERHGLVTRRGASRYALIFRRLVSKSRRITRVAGPDPLEEWLSNPVDLGARTNGARIDLDMY